MAEKIVLDENSKQTLLNSIITLNTNVKILQLNLTTSANSICTKLRNTGLAPIS